MKNQWQYWTILTTITITITITVIMTPSHCKELRPSTHGLPNNTTADSPQMSTFFNNGTSQPLPEATGAASNYTDNPTWRSSSGHVEGGDHVKKVLIVSSLVCGVAGVGLLVVVAGFVFLRRYTTTDQQQLPSS